MQYKIIDTKGIWYINYGTGEGNMWVNGTLKEAMDIADKNACYTQLSFAIYYKGLVLVAERSWNGYEAYSGHFKAQHNPIDFGSFGYYEDWIIYQKEL